MLRSLPAVLFCFVLLFSASFAQDPGDPDQLIIGADGMGPGETAVIPITISCDSDVGHITIPMSFDGVALDYDSVRFYGTAVEWDDISVLDRREDPDFPSDILTIQGWFDTGGGPNPPLNTSGDPVIIAELYFSAMPGASLGVYPIEITIDPRLGGLEFGNPGGNQWWVPQTQNGLIEITNEFGLTDSVFISCDTANAGDQVVIQISVFNDEEVDSLVIPIYFDTTAFYYLGSQFYGDILYWDDISITLNTDSSIATIIGTYDTGGDPNPYLNTNGGKEVIAELTFATNPSAAPGTYPVGITTDPVHGPLVFRENSTASLWTPEYSDGCIVLAHPPACDMRFDYLWAYGFCQSPSDDRRYASSIRNTGDVPAENVELVISVPSEFTYQYSVPSGSNEDGTITWQVGTLNPGQSYRVDWYVDIPPDLGAITVYTTGDITTSTYEINTANNHRVFEEIVGFSYDPNDKEVSPIGVTTNHFVTGEQAFQYTIYFENDSSATLPATDITVTDALDPNLDWTSFIPIEMSHPVPCSTYIDLGTGIVTLDCDDIFLQPDSEGFFTFSVNSRWDVSTGTILQNEAYIQFDINEPMVAPENGPVFNKIDKTMPVSYVDILPDTVLETSFMVSWASDDGEGSGVAYLDIYVSDDNGPYQLWLENVPYTSATYTGEHNHEYSFYSIATDYVDITETAPPGPDRKVFVKPLGTYATGDVNGSGGFNGLDIIYGVNFFKQTGPDPDCPIGSWPAPCDDFYYCGDVNGSCTYNGVDITYGVGFLKVNPDFPELLPCSGCPPPY